MGPTALRSFVFAILAVALLPGASCEPSGAQFAPQSGVLTVYGTAGADVFTVSVAGGAIVVNGGQVPIQGGVPTVANTVRIVLTGKDGSDFLELDESGGALPDGWLLGGPGADVLIGGSGDDEIEGGPGDDIALLGPGDDTFVWSEGGGVDTVEGEEGSDTLRSQGSAADESVDVAANSGRVLFYRSAGPVTTDLDDVEAIEYLPGAGVDNVVVGDLTGTDVTQVRVDLAGAVAGAGDGQADTVTVNGTQGNDGIWLDDEAGGVQVFGLQASVHVVRQQPADDRLIVNALAGHDGVDAIGVGPDLVQLVVNGGLGEDELIGSEGDDLVTGGDGNDGVYLGGGDDDFVWNPGDDLDTVQGQDGFDSLLLNAANVGENIDISAVGGRIRLFRNVATVTLDLVTIEAIDLPMRGGNDLVVVNDVSGTDLVEVNVDLAGVAGGGDGLADGVIVNGTAGADTVQVFGDASEVSVIGLAAQVSIAKPDDALDGLTIGTHAGEDLVHAASLTTPSLTLTADGGDHADVLIGGDGGDVLLGGEGDDVLQGGPGLDVLDGGPGDNIVIQ